MKYEKLLCSVCEGKGCNKCLGNGYILVTDRPAYTPFRSYVPHGSGPDMDRRSFIN